MPPLYSHLTRNLIFEVLVTVSSAMTEGYSSPQADGPPCPKGPWSVGDPMIWDTPDARPRHEAVQWQRSSLTAGGVPTVE